MMKKRNVCLLLALAGILLLAMCSCGNGGVPNKKEIKRELIDQEMNVWHLGGQTETLDIESLEIVRRKTEDGYDVADISVLFENKYYQVAAEYTLYHSYYDVGGWMLDGYTEIDHRSAALKAVMDELQAAIDKLREMNE